MVLKLSGQFHDPEAEWDDDPTCAECGVHRSEHALCQEGEYHSFTLTYTSYVAHEDDGDMEHYDFGPEEDAGDYEEDPMDALYGGNIDGGWENNPKNPKFAPDYCGPDAVAYYSELEAQWEANMEVKSR